MDNTDHWKLLEQLADPATSLDQRRDIESRLENDPHLRDQLLAFRVLTSWPALDRADRSESNSADALARMEALFAREAVDDEIKRAFPWVALVALAAAVVLAVINFGTMRDFSNTTLDALLGLPETSIEHTLTANL